MPNVDKGCVTHSFACDCREARMRKLEKVAEAAKSVLSEPVVAEHLSCYVMGVELIDRLAALGTE